MFSKLESFTFVVTMRSIFLILAISFPATMSSAEDKSRPPCESIEAFLGIPVDPKVAADLLKYPADWVYRQVGGELVAGSEGKTSLRGNVAKTFLATDLERRKLILKKYASAERAAKDNASMALVRERVKKYNIQIKVAESKISERNPDVLETEYFPGVDFYSFLEAKPLKDSGVKKLIRYYNREMSKLMYALLDQPYPSNLALSDSKPLSLMLNAGPESLRITIKYDNVLVSGNAADPNAVNFIIIDSN